MDGNFLQGGVVHGGASSYGGFNLQISMIFSIDTIPLHEGLPFTMVTGQDNDHQNKSMTEQHKGEIENSMSDDDDEPSLTEEGAHGHNEANILTKGSPWQRVETGVETNGIRSLWWLRFISEKNSLVISMEEEKTFELKVDEAKLQMLDWKSSCETESREISQDLWFCFLQEEEETEGD